MLVHGLQLPHQFAELLLHFHEFLHARGKPAAALRQFVVVGGLCLYAVQQLLHDLLLALHLCVQLRGTQTPFEEIEHLDSRLHYVLVALFHHFRTTARQRKRRLDRLLIAAFQLQCWHGLFIFGPFLQQTLF